MCTSKVVDCQIDDFFDQFDNFKFRPIVKWEKLQGYNGKCTFKGGWCKSKTLASPFSIYFPQTNSKDASLPPSLSACSCKCTEGPVQNFLLYIHSGPAQLHSECPFKVPPCSSEGSYIGSFFQPEQSLLWSTN